LPSIYQDGILNPMVITLKNNYFEAEINTKGAEINALRSKKTGSEFIWCGDPSVWKYHAPIIFPYVGRIRDGYIMIRGQKCELGPNGFARDMEHRLISSTDTKAVFELTESEETLLKYPCRFSLKTSYELTDTGLSFKTTVTNTDSDVLSFSIGSHTAFNCPRNTDPEGTSVSDYCIEFEKKESLTQVKTIPEGFLAFGDDGVCPSVHPYGEKDAGIIPLTADGFGNGHFFTAFNSDWAGLRNKKNNSIVKVTSKNYPYLMVWQNPGDPRFVCIEPWNGTPDAEATDHEWENKTGLISLECGESFTSDHSITIEE
jgi:galactose mutarotase-like enzyme